GPRHCASRGLHRAAGVLAAPAGVDAALSARGRALSEVPGSARRRGAVAAAQTLPGEPDGARREVAESSGLSLHAGIVAKASQRDKLAVGYHDPADPRVLRDGTVIAVEPFLSTRSRQVSEAADGWTLVGAAGNLSTQYEH